MREWKMKWIYIIDQPQEGHLYRLPPYTEGAALKRRSWAHHLLKEEVTEADFLWERIVRMKDIIVLTGVDIIVTWVRRQVQPL